MVKCESLRMNMYRITHTGKSMNFPVTLVFHAIIIYYEFKNLVICWYLSNSDVDVM